ncbi:MAG TPA: hypothetical protein VGA55_03805 [Bacteroidota bacterium]
MNRKTILSLLAVTAAGAVAFAQEPSDSSWIRFLPHDRIVADFPGDETAHRFSAATVFGSHEVPVSVGGTIPWADVEFFGTTVQLSSGASIRARLDPRRSIGILSTEFSVDFVLVDVPASPDLVVRTGIGHASHHLGDSGADSARKSIDYSRDYLRMAVVYVLGDPGPHVYGGLQYAYNFVVERHLNKPLTFQFGIGGTILHLGSAFFLYGGADLKVKEEFAFGTSRRIELGVEYANGRGRFVRLGLARRAGLDDRGQFFGKRREETTVGMCIEF